MSLTLNKTRFSPAQARVVPFVIFIAFIALESLLQSTVAAASLHNFDLRSLYAVRIMFTAAALAYFWRYYVELKSAIDIPISQWLTAIAVGIGVFILWINLDHPWLRTSVGKGFIPLESDGTLNIWLTIIRLTGAALIVPIIEELFWRSFILRWLDNQNFLQVDPASVSQKAFWISAALFASEHNLLFAGLLAGCAYNWLYMRTRNLWVPISAHAITNGLLGLWVVYTHNWQFW